MFAFVLYPNGPKEETRFELTINRKEIGSKLRADSKAIFAHLAKIEKDQVELQKVSDSLDKDGFIAIGEVKVDKSMITVAKHTKKSSGENITPAVIEPSFGIGRIIYCLLEHAYWVREGDEQRSILSLSPVIAPVKCGILPLLANDQLMPYVHKISKLLTTNNISSKIDDRSSASIGRRYSRTDEIGIPFGITVDFDTLKDDTVTLRERDSTKQVRVQINGLAILIGDLVNVRITWKDVLEKYPKFETKDE